MHEKIVEANLDLHWNWYKLTQHDKISNMFIEKHHDKPWDWKACSGFRQKSRLSRDFIATHPDFDWDWTELSFNGELPLHFYSATRNKPWNFSVLSRYISLAGLVAFPDLDWHWDIVSKNTNIDDGYLGANIDKPWNWYALTMNCGISSEFVEEHPERDWSWGDLSYHHVYTGESDDYGGGGGKELSYEFIEEHIDDYDWDFDTMADNHNGGKAFNMLVREKLNSRYAY